MSPSTVNTTLPYVQVDTLPGVVAILAPESLTFVFALSMIASFFDAFGIGANDVANSFATSVASKTLTLAKACMIAGIFEFLGALLLGNQTTKTVRKGIIDVDLFETRPDLLMVVMLCASIGAAIWQILATRFGYPVSTTHSTIGSIMGAGIAAFGFDTVDWAWDGVGKIIASFFISPAIAGCFGAIIFLITKYTILIWPNSTKRAIYSTSIYAMATTAIIVSFWVYKGSPQLNLDEKSIGVQLGIIFGATAFVGLLATFIAIPFLKKAVKKMVADEAAAVLDIASPEISYRKDGELETSPSALEIQSSSNNRQQEEKSVLNSSSLNSDNVLEVSSSSDESCSIDKNIEALAAKKSTTTTTRPNSYRRWRNRYDARCEMRNNLDGWWNKTKWVFTCKDGIMWFLDSYVLWGIRQDVAHNEGNQRIETLHDNATQYDEKTEMCFKWLQVMSCTAMAFSHGANDVANAVAPLSTVFEIWNNGADGANGGVSSSVEVPVWILVYGGLAINVGLFVMGWRIIYSLGNNLTYHSPSRGFSMEMGAVVTVLMATFLAIPVSTTHCITGATVGVGLCSLNLKSINWIQVAKCLLGWILTLPITALISGLVFLLLTNIPNINYVGIYQPFNGANALVNITDVFPQ